MHNFCTEALFRKYKKHNLKEKNSVKNELIPLWCYQLDQMQVQNNPTTHKAHQRSYDKDMLQVRYD